MAHPLQILESGGKTSLNASIPKSARDQTGPSPENSGPHAQTSLTDRIWFPCALLGLLTLVFYWIPLTNPNTTPQWDTVDYHYCVLRYFFESVHAGKLPYWTNYAFSGYPFMSDPQSGAWYPPNWLLFFTGVTPKTIELELALHTLLAGIGALLLASIWLKNMWARIAAAMFFMFSGFFTAHTSHYGMFQSAAWLPLLLFGIYRSIAGLDRRSIILTGAGVGTMVLAGHFQTAIYSFSALALYVAAITLMERKSAIRSAMIFVTVAVIAAGLSAIQWLPASVLAKESSRAAVTFGSQTNGYLILGTLTTLLLPNYYGAAKGAYTGPPDISQFYFYAGILLLPLASFGSGRSRLRGAGLALILPSLWFALGPAAVLYGIVTKLPGFAQVRAPIHIWFVVALGLAILAGGGVERIQSRYRIAFLAPALVFIAFADLWYWNSSANQLAYARESFERKYGTAASRLAAQATTVLKPGTRLYSSIDSFNFGPLNHALYNHLEVTYGYNPLVLARYSEYSKAASLGPKPAAGLNVGGRVDPASTLVTPVQPQEARFTIPDTVLLVDDASIIKADISGSKAGTVCLVEGSGPAIEQDRNGHIEVLESAEDRYRLRYAVRTTSALRAAIPWFPGWKAEANGRQLPLHAADHAFMAVILPRGNGEVTLKYATPRFVLGMWVSILSVLTTVTGLALAWRRRAETLPDKG